jgi:hypothetical protein
MEFLPITKKNLDKYGIIRKWVPASNFKMKSLPWYYKDANVGFLRSKTKPFPFDPIVLSHNGKYYLEDVKKSFDIMAKIDPNNFIIGIGKNS